MQHVVCVSIISYCSESHLRSWRDVWSRAPRSAETAKNNHTTLSLLSVCDIQNSESFLNYKPISEFQLR